MKQPREKPPGPGLSDYRSRPAGRAPVRRSIASRMVLVALAVIATWAMVSATLVLGPAGKASADDPCGPGSNPISCENSKPGTDPGTWDISGAGDDGIQGFSTDISVNGGQTIGFKIKTAASAYTIDIYRTGWYQGLGARKITSITPSATLPQSQPQCLSDVTTQLYDCGNWGLSASWAVPTTAVSGVYLALLTRKDNGGRSQVTFIVRDDASHSDVVFQTSDPTWQAYNTYGGADFYQGAANGRSFKVSYNRPVVTRGDNYGRDSYFGSEYPMVRFLEQNGYDVSYVAGVDTDRHGTLLTNHSVFLSVGHDEYWSAAQRANIKAAGDAGVNLQFLSGNDDYWHTRYESSTTDGTSYRTITCYKETWSNAKIDPAAEWTGTWRDPRFASPATGAGIPENGLSGTIYMSNYTDLPITVSSAEGKTRLWRNTSLTTLAAGTAQALAPHTVGYESNEDLDNGFRPQGLIHLSTTVGPTPQYMQDYGNVVLPGTTTHNITLYKAPGGALIFSAGSVQWSWGLDQTHDGDGDAAPADPRMRQAEVNLLADMGAQPATLDPALVRAAASTDTTPPVVVVNSPQAGAAIPNGTRVDISGTASDVGGVVAGVEVSTDGGTSWHAATGTATWTYHYLQHGVGTQNIQVRGIDDSANYPASPTSVQLQVGGPYSIFGNEVPKVIDSGDAGAIVLGLRFTASQNGYVSGVRFYKNTANTGTHTGTLWSPSGVALASATFANETASGWQSVKFASPVKVTAGESLVVSYQAPNGHYSYTTGYWDYFGTTASPMTVAGGFGAAPAGVYNTNASFPTDSYEGTNYFVDAILETTDTSPLSATAQTPAGGASSVAVSTPVSAVLSKDVVAGSVVMSLKDAAGVAVAGTTAYDPATRKAAFTPAAALAKGATYTASVGATDLGGGTVAAGAIWSFRTVLADAAGCPCGLYQDSAVPSVLSIAEGVPLSLGVKFSATSNGTVTGVKFYKGPGNTGTHVGTLFKADGTVLASATFSGESTTGWQTVTFPTAVPVTAGTEYTAAYTNPAGTYSATPGAYGSDVTAGPLHVTAGSATYSYNSNFPNSGSFASYLVDVVFQPAPVPLNATAQTPVPGSSNQPLTSGIEATFSAPLAAGYTAKVMNGLTVLAGTTALSTDGKTLAFTPLQSLPTDATITVTLGKLVSTQGDPSPDVVWQFGTGDGSPGPTSYSMFGSVVPQTPSNTGDTEAIELGVAFTPSAAGSVAAIRFFKGAGNTGPHTGSIWSAAGVRLATVEFTNETASGWQTAPLATPLPLTAGTTYTVSYYAPHGGYASTGAFFGTPFVEGPLTVEAGVNGRYLYGTGGGMPVNSWNSSNYFVDLAFTVPAP